MDSGVINTSSTPTRAESEGSTSPYRIPMEDTGASGTRKRPRLDSGERTYRSMSADRLQASPSNRVVEQSTTTQSNSSASNDNSISKPPMTPTKVTINVRETVTLEHFPKHPTDAVDQADTILTEQPSSSTPQSDSPKIVSVHSTPTSSPEIQVAEVEDVGDEHPVTRWRPLKDTVLEARRIQLEMLDEFSAFGSTKSLRRTLSQVALACEKNDLADGLLLEKLANWIEAYLEATQDISIYWWDLLTEERDLWDEFPTIIEGLCRRSDVSKGTIQTLQTDDDDPDSSMDPLTKFLSAWVALALRMTEIDRQTLKDTVADANTTPDLISDRYLTPLQPLMRYDAPCWRSLVEPARYNIKKSILVLLARFASMPADGIKCLTETASRILDRPASLTALIPKFTSHFMVPSFMASAYRIMPVDTKTAVLSFLPEQMHEYFDQINARLQILITKQIPGLSITFCQNLISALSNILTIVTSSDEGAARSLCDQMGIIGPGLSPDERADLLQLSWKFDTLKKCIVEGRMEIRVQGVDSMQQDLVSSYKKYVDGRLDRSEHPIAQFLSDFLIRNRIVHYLVSADSHPQLIHRSSNIIGFLIVTGRFSDSDIDVIWNAIASNLESRSGEAVLNMLSQCLSLCACSTLGYLIGKLNEVPVSGFDSKMQHFTSQLFNHLRDKWSPDDSDVARRLDVPPHDLWIRLIRQAAPDEPGSPDNARNVRDWACWHLRHLLQLGPTHEEKENILAECLDDISSPKLCATGSILAISSLIGEHKSYYIQHLSRNLNMTNILVNDLCRTVDGDAGAHMSSTSSHERLMIRLNLLSSVLHIAPETLSAEDASLLWDVLVGHKAISDTARDAAWESLINIARSSGSRNPYIDLCISKLLPNLHPRFLVPGCLAFAEVVKHYIVQSAESRSPDEQLQGPTAAELMWHLSLTVPSGRAGMERRAISMLIELYLDSPDAHRRSREANDSLHIELVERCIRQLTSAASRLRSYNDGTSSGEDEPMVIVASDDEAQAQKLCFLRSLMILKEFVQGVRSRPMYSPSPEMPSKLPKDFDQLKGEPIAIKYQAFPGGRKNGDISIFHVGSLETVNGFSQKMSLLTGFSNFIAIAGGKKLPLDSWGDRKLEEVDFYTKGLLLIRRTATAEAMPNEILESGLRPMEIEVLRHFDDLYKLLIMEDGLALQVYEFLVEFPPHRSINDMVCLPHTPPETMFPSVAPFKVLYSAHALKLSLSQQLQTQTVSREFVVKTIAKLTTTLIQNYNHVGSQGFEAELIVVEGLVSCLETFMRTLRDPQCFSNREKKQNLEGDLVIVEKNGLPLPDTAALVDRCLSLISQATAMGENTEADKLVHGTFSILLEANLVSGESWTALKNTQMVPWLFKRLLLEEHRMSSRQAVTKTIKKVCLSNFGSTPLPEDFISTLVDAVIEIIPESSKLGKNSEQFFDITHALIGSLSPAEQQRMDVNQHTEEWINLLLKHEHSEVVGRNDTDYFVLGLARLCVYSFQLAKSLGKPLTIRPDILENLFHSQLFPDLYDLERIPNLHSPTREQLYYIVLALSDEKTSYCKLLNLVRDLSLPGEEISQAWSWGIAQTTDDDNYEPNWNIERYKCVRSPVGYPGLRNLSNTCYMNSLLTQLFMNTKFRDFILCVNIADSAVSQRLLYETQILFSFMQESTLKSIDTQNITDSIVTYDNTGIDITHQVDVDEFFNLLFDRWESQILNEDDKKKFRSFFGGQIVQQIKSKECSHISERLESFSAIQCDISGKTTLAESLNAYVQGEAMEGDNKYSCTSCGKYVDAVKRACLKDVPDNLIFHLKRFDYDLMHGTRTKINDRFEFPMEVDMAPYNVDYLKDPAQPSTPDIFALVGVLVHSGTAESGHYYSFIQERPSPTPRHAKWVEFNDVDVTDFNPTDIDDKCFGGWHETPPPYENRYLKLWNAYMLFYERMDSLPSYTHESIRSPFNNPIKSAIASDLKSRITICNQGFLRQFCLYDSAYALFSRNMLKQLRAVYSGDCSADHMVEKEAIWLSLEYLGKVLARMKDTSQFDEMLSTLTRVIGSCAMCCDLALQWVKNHDFPLADLLLRCPHVKVRRDFASMIILTLQKLRLKAPLDYGYVSDEHDNLHPSELELPLAPCTGAFYGIAARLSGLWESIHLSPRAWDDYFGLLAEIANIGPQESHVLLKLGFLQRCLELLVCETTSARGIRLHQPYASYIRMLEKGRKFSYTKLIELVANLFDRIDFREEAIVGGCSERPFNAKHMPLTVQEYNHLHLRLVGAKSICVFLEKILNCATHPLATKRIVRTIVLAEPKSRFHPLIFYTIKSGINIDPAYLAAPFLRAALVFCECTPTASTAEKLINEIASEVHTIGQTGGREHLEFFLQARRLRSLRGIAPPDFFNRCVLVSMSQWAPQLLMYWEEDVRQDTIELLRILLFQYDINSMDDEEMADELLENGKKLCIACAKRCQFVLEGSRPLSRTAGAIVDVITTCLKTFFTEDDRVFISSALDVVARINALAVSDLDDQASVEWANGSDLPTDSDSDAFENTP